MTGKDPVAPSRLCFLALCLVAASASAGSRCDQVTMELRLAEVAIPLDGVVVGELVFTNTGRDTSGICAGVSLCGHSGRLVYDLERPDGRVVELRVRNLGDRESWQFARLGPGDWAAVPVFLLKLDGEFLFAATGTYRLRAVSDRHAPAGAARSSPAEVAVRQSNWCELRVTEPGPGHAAWIRAVGGTNVYAALRHPRGAAEMYRNLEDFQAYRREAEKYIVYQLKGLSVLYALRNPGWQTEESLIRARMALALARKRGLGVAFWEWIEAHFDPHQEQYYRRGVARVCNGYFFPS